MTHPATSPPCVTGLTGGLSAGSPPVFSKLRDKPVAIDLFCGLGGWTDGLLAEGYDVTGYDIEAHEYGDMKYPAKLILRDVLTIHGSQFAHADLIVASPPCQAYSYMAMPWSLAKAKAAAIRADTTGRDLHDLNALFNACFRIQREACEAAGRHIPMVVENVRGAIPWVGRSAWNYGSFHLWGDVPALMPAAVKASGAKNAGGSWFNIGGPGQKVTGANPVHDLAGIKGVPHRTKGHWTNPAEHEVNQDTGRKGSGSGSEWFDQNLCVLSSKSPARKMASAMIAKIPMPLSRHIAATFNPRSQP